MWSKLCVLAAGVALTAANFTDQEIAAFESQGLFSADQLKAIKGLNARERRAGHEGSADSGADAFTFVTNSADGSKIGVQFGEDAEKQYFADFEWDKNKMSAANLNAVATGYQIGGAFYNELTKSIIKSAAAAPAAKVDAAQAAWMAQLDEATKARIANTQFRIKKLGAKCAADEFEVMQASGGSVKDFKGPVCRKFTTCGANQFETTAATSVADRECSAATVCGSGEFESVPLGATSDRECKTATVCPDTHYQTKAATKTSDTECAKLTKCAGNEAETKAATKTSDRQCGAVNVDCHGLRGQGTKKFNVKARDGSGKLVEVYCHNDGSLLGGDGKSKATAGKTCGTIRRWYKEQSNGKYWIFMDDPSDAVEVFCDMQSCGNDAQNLGWGNKRTDMKCGGWALAVKIAGAGVCSNNNDATKGCWYFNRNNEAQWRYGKLHGDKCVDESEKNALGPAYNRHEFSDIMMRTIEPRVKTSPWRRSRDHARRPWQSVAWRHPWVKKSVRAVAQACRPLQDGQPLHPNGATMNRGQMHRMFARGINWESRSESQHHLPSNPRNKWGFFLHDGGGCANNRKVVGCDFEWSGHARNFIGYGLDETHDSAFRGGGWGHRITSFGMGSGYCSASGGYGSRDRWSMTGHWWGHGASNMQARSTGLFVRNKYDLEDIPFA